MGRVISLWTILCAVHPVAAFAAQRRGTPVRVRDTAGLVVVGTVEALDSTLLVLMVLDTNNVSRVSIPRVAIRDVEPLDGPVLDRRVRVTHSCQGSLPGFPPELTGTVQSLTSDTLMLLEQTGAPVPLRLACLRTLGVYRGRGSAAGQGAVAGLALGISAGVGLGYAELEACKKGPEDYYCGLYIVFLPPLGAAVGTLLGAMIGSVVTVDRWGDVSLSAVRSRTGAVSGAIRVGGRLTF